MCEILLKCLFKFSYVRNHSFWTLIAIVLPVQFNFLTSKVSVLQVAHSTIRRQAAIYPLVQLKYVKFLLFVNRQYQLW